MSLVIWLPLNNSIINYGTSNLNFTSLSGSSLTNAGKVTVCCYSNTSYSSGGYVSNNTITLGQSQSVCAWVKFSSLNSDSSLGGSIAGQHRYLSNVGMGMTIKYVSSTTGYLSVNTGNGSSRTYNTYCGSTLLQANTWYHLCYTYDGSTIRLYVNGNLDGSHAYTGMSTPADYFMIGCWSFANASGNGVYDNYKLNGYINDLRAYNHTLSTKEIKELARGLILHYTFNTEDLTDSSGLRHNGSGSVSYSTTTNIGRRSASFNGSSNYVYRSIPLTTAMTYACWLKFGSTGSYHIIDNRAPSGETGTQPMYGGTTYGLQCYSSAGGSYTWSASTCGFTTGTWYHVVVTMTSTNATLYINGVSKGTQSGSFGSDFGSREMRLGTRCSGANWFNGQVSDFRVYATALAQTDVTALYQVRESIDNKGGIYCNIVEEDTTLTKTSFLKTGSIKTSSLYETVTLEDGSTWLPICIHNVANGVFSNSGDFTTLNSQAIDKWSNFGLINVVNRPESGWYEFMVQHQTSVGGGFERYRWKQNKNPFNATWDDVNPAKVGTNVTRISATTTNSYAGMYWYNASNCKMCFANTSNGNWFGCGICSYWGTGYIPSYNGQQCYGWQLVYIRVSSTTNRLLKNGFLETREIKEN